MRFQAFVIVVIVVMLLGVIPAAAQGTGVIRGVVMRQNSGHRNIGGPVRGATVFLPETQESVITDSKGRFEFTGLEPGLYDLAVGAKKLGGISKKVWLYRPGEEKTIVIELRGPTVPIISETLDQVDMERYSAHLTALKEPPLCDGYADSTPGEDTYRFLWLRTHHNPMLIKLRILPDGTGVVTIKRTKGKGGEKPGKSVKPKTRNVDAMIVRMFLGHVETIEFWDLPTTFERQYRHPNGELSQITSEGGAQWIIEGRSQGRCHITDRRSPPYDGYRSLGMLFLSYMAKLDFSMMELY